MRLLIAAAAIALFSAPTGAAIVTYALPETAFATFAIEHSSPADWFAERVEALPFTFPGFGLTLDTAVTDRRGRCWIATCRTGWPSAAPG